MALAFLGAQCTCQNPSSTGLHQSGSTTWMLLPYRRLRANGAVVIELPIRPRPFPSASSAEPPPHRFRGALSTSARTQAVSATRPAAVGSASLGRARWQCHGGRGAWRPGLPAYLGAPRVPGHPRPWQHAGIYAVSALLSRAHTSSSAQAGQTRCATGRSVVGLDVTAAAPTAPSSFVFV